MILRNLSKKVPIYHVIEEELRERIRRGLWKEGEKIISPQEICREFKVSMITVNRSLRNLSEAGVIERHPGRGNFVRRFSAPSEKSSTNTQAIALVGIQRTPNIFFEGFYSQICRAIVNFEQEAGFEVRIAYLPADEKAMPYTPHEWLGTNIKGIVFMAVSGFCAQAVALAQRYQLPAVMVDSYVEGWPSVVSDHAGAALRICRELLARGHRRIGYLGNHVFGNNLNNEAERAAIFAPIARDLGLELQNRTALQFAENPESQAGIAKWVREEKVSALVCSTYKQYMDYRRLFAGETHPEFSQISFVAMDAWMSDLPGVPRLAGTITDQDELGRVAGEWMAQLIANPAALREHAGKQPVPMKWQDGPTLKK